jgi:hypothetical protein
MKSARRVIRLIQTDQEYQILAFMLAAMMLIPIFLFSLVILSTPTEPVTPKYRIPTTPVITEPVYSPTPVPTSGSFDNLPGQER